jgi:hypothetical protein
MFTNNQCGGGTPGAACVGCQNGGTCDLDAGSCVGGSGGGGGGLDAGIPGLCTTSADCGGGCCDGFPPILGICTNAGDPCLLLGTCNGTSHTCQ